MKDNEYHEIFLAALNAPYPISMMPFNQRMIITSALYLANKARKNRDRIIEIV